MICVIIATQTSNIISNRTTGYPDAVVFQSKKYKTSLLYGTKVILIPKDMFAEMKTYVSQLRAHLNHDDDKSDSDRPLFTSSRCGFHKPQKMDHLSPTDYPPVFEIHVCSMRLKELYQP